MTEFDELPTDIDTAQFDWGRGDWDIDEAAITDTSDNQSETTDDDPVAITAPIDNNYELGTEQTDPAAISRAAGALAVDSNIGEAPGDDTTEESRQDKLETSAAEEPVEPSGPIAGNSGDKPPTDPPNHEAVSAADDGDDSENPGEQAGKVRWGRGEVRPALQTTVQLLQDRGIDIESALEKYPRLRRILPKLLDNTKTVQEISEEEGTSTTYVSQQASRIIEGLRGAVPEELGNTIPRPQPVPTRPVEHKPRRTRTNKPSDSETAAPPKVDTAPIDLRQIIPAAHAGDAEAERKLFDLTTKAVDGALHKWAQAGADIEGIRGDVRERLLRNPFDPSWPIPEGMDPADAPSIVRSRYVRYIRLAVRSAAVDQLTANRDITSEITDTDTTLAEVEAASTTRYDNSDVTAALPAETLDEILTADQRTVVDLRAAGKNNDEIAQELGVDVTVVKSRLTRARRNIEKTMLEPAGLKSIDETSDPKYHRRLARQGKIQALNVLGKTYIKNEWLPQGLGEGNFVRIGEIASNAAVITFRRLYPERLVQHKGTYHIREEDLSLLHDIQARKESERRPLPPPEPGLAAVPDVAATQVESNILYGQIQRGTFPNARRHKGNWFVPVDEAREFIERLRRRDSD